MLRTLPLEIGRHEVHQQFLNQGISSRVQPERTRLHVVEDELDPRMIVRVVQAVEGLPKGQVADDVEGRPVVPRDHVEAPGPPSTLFVELAEQQVNVALDDGLLVGHRMRREAMRQGPAEAGVVLAGGADDALSAVHREDGVSAVVARAVFEVAVDVPPGVWVVVRELVGGDAHDGAVLPMQRQDSAVHLSGEAAAGVRDPRGCPELGAGVSAQGMEVDIVDDDSEKVGKSLLLVSSGTIQESRT